MPRRTRGMLTEKDIEFLLSDDYYEGENARQLRYQRRRDIRGRIMSSVLDFDIVRSHLSKEERDKIFTEPEKNGADSKAEFEDSLSALLGWIYLGCRSEDTDIDFERILESTIILAEEEYYQTYRDRPVDVSVDLDINVAKKYTKISDLARMLEEGEPVEVNAMFKLPLIGEVPIDPDKVENVKVKSPSQPKRLEKEKRMIESILSEHLGIDTEVEMEGTQTHATLTEDDFKESMDDDDLGTILDSDPTAVVPPEDFESRE